LTRIWARRGSRPAAPRDQRYKWAYLFGAVCPQRACAAGLVLPCANTKAMIAHLDEISRAVAPGAHAVLVMDGAGYHEKAIASLPSNISLLTLPAYSPELNPVENVWQFLRQNHLANRVFEDYDAILDACCDAWRNFLRRCQQIR
jgi:transposase